MNGAGSARRPEQCQDKQALIDQVRAVISMIASIHNEELEDVLNGRYSPSDSIARRLQDARELKGFLLDLFRRHVAEHNC